MIGLRWTLRLAGAVGLSWLVLGAAEALARPGGGQSYSGGGGSGDSSGGGGDAELVFLVVRLALWLCLEHPVIGIPLTIGVAVYVYRKRSSLGAKLRGPGEEQWSSAAGRRPSARRTLARLRESDPDFSVILFEDFAYGLYARVHAERARGALEPLTPYVAPQLREAVGRARGDLVRVEGVIVGALRIHAVQLPAPGRPEAEVQISFDANYTEVRADGRSQTFWVVEQWKLVRKAGVKSRPPAAVAAFNCPSCGGAAGYTNGVCAFCGQTVDTGDFDWLLTAIDTLRREPRAPNLASHAEEQGTELPTRYAPALEASLRALTARDPSLELAGVQRRLALIFRELNQAWSAQAWKGARPYTSDQLFQSQVYMMEAYRRAGLKNITERARITKTELVSVTQDRWYEAVTFRLYATGLDYTVRAGDGALVSGSKRKERVYSEYWTLMRSAGVSRPAKDTANCPSCGANLNVNMAGECAYCEAKITGGDFDWVLSKIEQDEAYGG